MSEKPDTYFYKSFLDALRVDTYWVRTNFPNLILLCQRKNWVSESEIDYNLLSCLIEDGNIPPKWLSAITKNNPLEIPEISFVSNVCSPYEESSDDWEADSMEEDNIVSKNEVDYLFDFDREYQTIKHICDKNAYAYFEYSSPHGFWIGLLDGVEYDDIEAFWEAVQSQEEILYGISEFDWFNQSYSKVGLATCSECIPAFEDQFQASAVEAIQEIIEATSLSSEQKETIDSLLMPVLSIPDENEIDEDTLSHLKKSIAELAQKYPGDFPQLEYWLATN